MTTEKMDPLPYPAALAHGMNSCVIVATFSRAAITVVCMSQTKLCVENVSMTFPTPAGPFAALAPITLAIPQGRFVSLIGPSGCGKSTIFNIIAGLLEPTGGRVLIDGMDATGTIGRVGYMLQKDLLLPWRTVLDNVILGMEIQAVPLRMARERALPLLQRYGLAGFEYLYPSSLSGGMRQRAALLRTLAVRHRSHSAR